MKADQVTLHRLRAHVPEGTEPLIARLRLEHLLKTADFPPVGLPPHAILLLRHVQVQKALDMERLRVSTEWERSLRDEVSRQFRGATRPTNGRIPPEATALLFEDSAELMAFLSLLLPDPAHESLWIWQACVGSLSPSPQPDALTRHWLQTPRFVPGALSHLERWGAMTEVLRLLSDGHLAALFTAVASEFDLHLRVQDLERHSFADSFEHSAPPDAARGTGSDAVVDFKRGITPFSDSNDSRRRSGAETDDHAARKSAKPSGTDRQWNTLPPLPDWFRASRHTGSGLRPVAQSLLTLYRAIQLSGSRTECETGLQAIRSWLRPGGGATADTDPTASRRRPSSPIESARVDRESAQAGDEAPETGKRNPAEDSQPVDSTIADSRTTSISVPPADRMEDRTGTETAQASANSRTGRGLTNEAYESEGERTEMESSPEPLWNGLEGIRTRLAGVFYLINFFLRTDAPACFDFRAEFGLTEPLTDHLSTWGLAESFARALLASDSDSFESDSFESDSFEPDALWPLLARLDGRSPDAEIAPNLPQRAEVLNAIYSHMEADLRRRLSANDPQMLLRVSGLIYVGQIHIDVVMPLDAIWMPARIAGLDASPGWLPELMRVVMLHFV